MMARGQRRNNSDGGNDGKDTRMTSRGGFTMSSNAADEAGGYEADQPLASPRRRSHQARNRRSSVTRSAALALASVLGVGVLAACGDGSTATQDDSDSATTTQARSSSSSSSSTKSSASSSSSSSKKSADSNNGVGDSPDAKDDETPVEVSRVPAPNRGQRTDEEKKFLATIQKDKINVDGSAADQVIASAMEYCQAKAEGQDSFSVRAMAGQLIEQKLTDQPLDQVERAITDTADSDLCGD
ncbi:MAG: hypothetical protein DI525_00740 [Corynebacterium kroppenstedtii]|uniref:DUF732 domain-containing protein n=2 Tax=Corynebacterium kroppenstedtii TaxID=161879 RepID=A0A2W5T1V7_9CORY|nr:MAG: hypothetical protein DI525_00740 [Corynebacterium kroppenstedtii]